MRGSSYKACAAKANPLALPIPALGTVASGLALPTQIGSGCGLLFAAPSNKVAA